MNEKFSEALENNICPECGAKLIIETIKGSNLFKCSECDWAMVGPALNEEQNDYTAYTVFLMQDSMASKDKMFKISKLTGWNILRVKEALSNSKTIIMTGTVSDIKEIVKELRDNCINHSIEPEYRY